MKAVLYKKFGNKIEEVTNLTDKKKRWRFKKGTMNWLINFSSADFANLEHCTNLLKSKAKQKEIEELIAKIKALNPQNISEIDIAEISLNQSYATRQGFRETLKIDTMQVVNDGILAQKQLKIKYDKSDKEVITNP